jgi:hypothetical protein
VRGRTPRAADFDHDQYDDIVVVDLEFVGAGAEELGSSAAAGVFGESSCGAGARRTGR